MVVSFNSNYLRTFFVVFIFACTVIHPMLAQNWIYEDCTSSCLYPLEYGIESNNTLDHVALTQTFTLTFDLKLVRDCTCSSCIALFSLFLVEVAFEIIEYFRHIFHNTQIKSPLDIY